MTEHPVIEPRRKGRSGTQTMLIPSRNMLSAALRELPAGRFTDAGIVRRSLAEQHGADACCPVTVQRLLVDISADSDAPYWRAVDPDRALAKRTIGGPAAIRNKLAQERE